MKSDGYQTLCIASTKRQRLDVQGLRCLAVCAVMAYHLWPGVAPNGLLGVDIFFVISGYLMKTLSLRSASIDLTFAADFYYRRLRRLAPLYIAVLIITVSLSAAIMKAEDVSKALLEAGFAAGFVSNTYGIPENGYSHSTNEFPLFLHTWSLSTEMQFYLICPLLLYVFSKLTRIHGCIGFVTVTATAFLSAAVHYYTRENENFSYMALPCRIWQFLLGFLVVDLQQPRTESVMRNFISHIFTLAIILLLAVSFTSETILDRLLITMATSGLIAVGGAAALENRWLVWLGNCSYGIYMAHWPLFVFHKYLFSKFYTEDVGPILSDGVFCAMAAVILGYYTEKIVTSFSGKLITNKYSLVVSLAVLYAILALICSSVTILKPQPNANFNTKNSTHSGRFYNNTVLDTSIDIYEGKVYNWTREEVRNTVAEYE